MNHIDLNGRTSRVRQLLLATSALCVGLLQTAAASAQSAPAPANGAIETVIVTAEKRTEKLKNTPADIHVLNQRRLDQIGADDLETFALTVPGLDVQNFAPGQSRITIRGISPDEQTGVTAVAYYIDEIPVTAAGQRSQPEVYLYDISQVEVLNGPQGTLYGQSAMGGAIRIVTNKPDTENYEASGLADVYSIHDGGIGYKLDGMVNIPIIQDMLALRVDLETRDNAGWINDTIYSIPNPAAPPPGRYVVSSVEKDANQSHDSSMRAALRFTPTSKLTIDTTFITDNIKADTSDIADVNQTTNVDLGLRPSKDVSELGNITATYVFDDFTVTSASTYTERRTSTSEYQEPILLGTNLFSSFFEYGPQDHQHAFTQEVRAVSDSDQRFRWTAGFYYSNSFDNSYLTATADYPAISDPTYPLFAFPSASHYNTYAFFGQAEYDILTNLTAIVGARWYDEGQTEALYPGFVHSRDNGWTPLATLRYRIDDDWMTYATFSEGYRPGGFNPYAGPLTYAPDKIKNYELGTKYATPDNRFTISGDVYYIDWSDMQYTQLSSGGFFTYIGNASKASSRGLEFTGEYHWDNGLWSQLNASWTDAHLDAPVPLTQGFLDGTAGAGTPLPAVPPYKVSLAGGYNTTVMDNYGLSLSGVVSFVGDQHTKLEEGAEYTDPIFGGTYTIGAKLPAYATGNLRAELSKDNYSIALYMNNVWNTSTPVADDNFFPTFGQPYYYLQPRTIGLQLAAHF